MVANGDGNGARKLDDDAAMRLLSKLYDHDDNLDDVAEEETPAEPETETAGAEAGFRELRSVFAEMRESLAEEPPARGMEALLAAAAANVAKPATRRAAVVEPEPGFFAKLRDGWMRLMAHPGMMAAAGLVVVAGVAGTIYFKTGAVDGGASENETRSATMSVSEQRARPDGVEQGAVNPAGPRQQAPADVAESVVAEGAVADKPSKTEPVKGPEVERTSEGSKLAPAKPNVKSPSQSLPKIAPKPSTKSDNRNGFGYNEPSFGGGGLGGSGLGGGGATEGANQVADMEDAVAPPAPPPAVTQPTTKPAPVSKPVAPSKAKPPAPDPQPAAPAAAPAPIEVQRSNNAPAKKPMDLAIDGNEKSMSTATGKDAPSPASLLTAAKAAAAKGDCARARTLAEQARVGDKRAYDLALKNDAKLRQCFEPAN
jgi:hypothetical protein